MTALHSIFTRALFFILVGCTGDFSGTADSAGPPKDLGDSSAGVDSAGVDTAPPQYQLAIGSVPPDFTLMDINPSSESSDQPVTVSDKTGFVTGWYFFKSS